MNHPKEKFFSLPPQVRHSVPFPKLSLSGPQLLERAFFQDSMLPGLASSMRKEAASAVLLTYGLVLRKGGLFKIAGKAWSFACTANMRRYYGADSRKIPFLALQASRCVHHSGYDPSRTVLDETDISLIDTVYGSMCVPDFDDPLDLFYYYRLQLIDFPHTKQFSRVVHVDFGRGKILDWGAPCPCRSCIPYGECCGLYL